MLLITVLNVLFITILLPTLELLLRVDRRALGDTLRVTSGASEFAYRVCISGIRLLGGRSLQSALSARGGAAALLGNSGAALSGSKDAGLLASSGAGLLRSESVGLLGKSIAGLLRSESVGLLGKSIAELPGKSKALLLGSKSAGLLASGSLRLVGNVLHCGKRRE